MQPSGSATTQGQRVDGIRIGTAARNPERQRDRISVDRMLTDEAFGESVDEVGVGARIVPIVDGRLSSRPQG
ncbi:hypothetical protein [Thiocapsa marina]|uniref:Uncharacterized protein n=1 Tax=Thiocapsa marina 5811 TaxID=768671 RepID=F9UI16_9GAMM|nr:hypothetical protein [Thiocapsa marina]EGV16192.1 hypothetical protein ThimaDRAFT_4569 [Thiocapsa marina 5811]